MKKAFSKSLSWLLSVVMIFGLFIVPSVSVSATQSASGGFSTGYTLTGNGFTDMVNIAMAQNEKTQAQIGYSESWCADFVSDCARLAGQESAIPFNGVVQSMYNAVINAGGYVVSSPQAGDLVFFTNGSSYGHVGIALDSSSNISGNIWYNGNPPSKVMVLKNSWEGFSSWTYVRPNYKTNNPVPTDTVAPTISDVKAVDVSGEAFTIQCQLSDNVGVTRVWLVIYGPNGEKQFGVSASNGEFSYTVNTSDYGGSGDYAFHIYAFDAAENSTKAVSEQIHAVSIPTGHVMSESEAVGQTIPDGDYYIVSEINPDYFFDISGDDFDTQNGANVQMWTWGSSIPNSAGYDCFHFEYLNNGFYKITQINTNMCLDVSGASLKRGTNVQMWNYDGNNAQQWSIEQTPHGYRLRARCNAYYLDVYNGNHEPGTNVWCWEGNNSKAQSFSFIPRDLNEQPVSDGVYVIRPNVSNQHFLDVAGTPDEFHAGSHVQIWRSADSDVDDKFEVVYVSDGWYKITEQTSELALEVADSESNFLNNSKNVQLGNYNGGKNQLWKIKKNADSSYFIINKLSGYYLDFESGRLNNGTNVKQYTFNGDFPQRWAFEIDYNLEPITKSDFNGHTYEYYNQKIDWNQAYKFCEKKGGHLVTITSKEENDFVAKFMKDQSTDVWTGGRTFDAETWFWITGESFDYQNWNTNQPDYYNNEEDSLEIYVANGPIGTWNDLPQTNITHCGFICEYDNEIDASKYQPVYKENYNGHEYWFFEDKVDWQTAKKICEAKGGYLAIPNNADENAFILSGIKKTSKEEAWIGVTDIAKEGEWKDVKGNSITYSNWDDGEPSNYFGIEDYVEMYSSGKWNDLRGFGANYRSVGFVCEFDDLCTGSGHKYIETVIAPTTTQHGYTVHTCPVCGDSYKDNYTDKLVENLTNNSMLSAKTIKLGETITATAKATGGTGEYLYQVVYKQKAQTKWTTAQAYKAKTSVSFKPAKATEYDVCVKVKDSNNTEVKKFFTVTVTSDTLKNESTISAETINLGDTVTINAKASGSTGFYTYAVYYKQKAQTKWTTKQDFKAKNTVAVKPAKATTYDICVKVKDDKDTIVKKYFTVNVTDFVNTSTLSATEIKLGNTLKVSCSATGSTGYYQYAVYYKKTSDTKWTTKQSYSSNNTVTIKPVKATTYDVCVKVKDNQNNEVKKYFTLTVK